MCMSDISFRMIYDRNYIEFLFFYAIAFFRFHLKLKLEKCISEKKAVILLF